MWKKLQLVLRAVLSLLLLPGALFRRGMPCDDFNWQADFCFEVSSVGELEQVWPLIERFIEQGFKVELIYFSPSLLGRIAAIKNMYSKDQLRVMAYPLFWPWVGNLWGQISAPVVILCRYDFFPELLYLRKRGKKLALLSALRKNEKWLHQHFDYVSFADECDLRVARIFKRLLNKDKVLSEKLSAEEMALKKKMVIGNAWPSDIRFLKTAPELFYEWDIWVVPHSLKKENLDKIKKELGALPHHMVSRPGFLCEFYTLFEYAWVGGGFHRSIHSVLEPYMAGCRVFVGGNTSRSSEFKALSAWVKKIDHPKQIFENYEWEDKRDQLLNNSVKMAEVLYHKIIQLKGN